MKHLSVLVAIAAGFAGFAMAQAPAQPRAAQPKVASAPSPIKIGVVQVSGALAKTIEGKKAIAAMNAEFDSRRKDLAQRKSAIEDLQLRLNIGGNNLSAADRDALTRRIDQQTKDQNRLVDDMQAEVEQEEQRIFGQLGQKLVQVIQKYALANGFTIVVNTRSTLVYFDKSIDITAEIVSLYDKEPPAAPAPAPTKPASAAPRPAPPKK